MVATLHKTNWQNQYISKNYVVSLLLSCTIVLLVLSIPFKPMQLDIAETYLKITLSKENLQKNPVQIKKFENTLETKPLTQQKVQNTTVKKTRKVSKTNKPIRVIQKSATKKPNKQIKLQPKALDILNSIKNYQPLEEVGLDFQAKNDKFIYNNIIKPQEKKLIVVNKIARGINVKNPDSLLVAGAKKALGFFSAIDEPEKTVDSIPYCALYGRNTFHCPISLFW